MYCINCGKQIPDGAKFCPECGVSQSKDKAASQSRSVGKRIWKVLRIAVILLFGIIVLAAIFGDSEENDLVTLKKDGWVEEDGKSCYYENGEAVTGWKTIDGQKYYFDSTGAAAKNTAAMIGTDEYTFDASGNVESICYFDVSSHWAEENYYHSDGSSSLVRVLSRKLENCSSFTLILESEAKYGASAVGKWNVYIRNNGQWKHVGSVQYEGGVAELPIYFDSPQDFDAISAQFSTWGNFTYECYFGIAEARCLP